MNKLYEKKIPFFFIVDYGCNECELVELSTISATDILYATPNSSNIKTVARIDKPLIWQKFPIEKELYKAAFDKVKEAIQRGDSYLLNLSFSTPVKTNYSLKALFQSGESKYKLYYKNRFIHFSPEPFVQIIGDKIYSFPMKGTIDASDKDAEKNILSNEKELFEQYTIVDLIRNDLSIVASRVRVDDFRYVEKLVTNQKELLTVSSKISGIVKEEYKNKIGHLFASLLPAGSILGAPKAKTVELIADIEIHERNYYTGVWGIFDGKNTDSCVIIRYLENTKEGLVFKSGGGITAMSDLDTEYQEMIDKVYVPIY